MQICRSLFSPGARRSRTARILLALFSILTSVAFGWGLLTNVHSAAHADPTLFETYVPAIDQSFGAEPWGLAFDNAGHILVAEPQCDVNISVVPICNQTIQSGILEYPRQGFTNGSTPVQTFKEPPGYSSPFFLALDAHWDLWFTEPVTNAIGELDTSYHWHQWTVPTAKASPLDLTFDQYGHLWFTEPSASQIGEFDPAMDTFKEYATPTSQSLPYGIAGPDPTTHSIWFTENSQHVHRIGRIMPNADGTINGKIQEYLTNSSNSGGITPHLVTFDNNGNIWWSEGYDRSIGQLVISQAANGTNHGVTEYVVPAPACPVPPGSCGSHISGIAIDSKGTVWFDDSLSSRYGSFVPATSTFTMYIIDGCVTNNTHPHDGLAVDGNNNIWISEEFANKLAEALPGTITNPRPCSTSTIPPTAGSSPSPTPPPPVAVGPVSKAWYFGEGRVGAGFTEWLTLGNPSGSDCQATVQYYYTPDSGSPHSKTLAVSVPRYTRVTRLVNQDLAISSTGGGNSVSATVDVGSSCPGIVAERPIYNTTFGNPLGVNSGTDVLGATHTGTSFYFADVRSGPQNGGSVSSFIPILNNGPATATVTASYFAGGKQVGQQTTAVAPGTRGTIYPGRASPSLPARVAARVTSNQPVLIEQPSYFNHLSEGNAGTVSGEADVVGVQQPSQDFLFAEGYTGGSFQEDLLLANFGTSAINGGTLLLEYTTGATYAFPVTIAAQDQSLIDLNQLTANPAAHGGTCLSSSTTCVSSQDVSIEVKAAAGFVAEREMYFHYSHTTSYGRALATQGVSEVMGQGGPASASAYSFAEGYTNAGYDEWLTVQNPTGSAETITITLSNAKGTTYTSQVTIGAHSRYTQDIAAIVLQHLYHNGDGFEGFEVSMALQSKSGPFVAERPMYWNASGTQGGDDVIGYRGN